MISSIDKRNHREHVMPPALERAHSYAAKVLQENEISMVEFARQRGAQRIERHRAYVAKRTAQFEAEDTPQEKQDRKLAEVLEAILLEQTELADWLGSNTNTLKTSKYDDIANGVDLVFEYSDAERASHSAAAIDATYSVLGVSKKMREVRTRIAHRNLAPIEYFKSEALKIQGSIDQVPKLILGMERERALELAGRWVQMKDGRLSKKSFAEDPVRLLLLQQIEMQVEAFRAYAAEVGNDDAAIAYSRIRALVSNAKENIPAEALQMRHYEKDAIARAIAQECQTMHATRP